MKSKSNPKSKIDWEDIHLIMNDLHEKLAHTSYLTRDEKRAIMISRAQELARESRKKNKHDLIEIISFRLASEANGLEPENMREALPMKDFTNDQLIILDAAYLLIDNNIIVNEKSYLKLVVGKKLTTKTRLPAASRENTKTCTELAKVNTHKILSKT